MLTLWPIEYSDKQLFQDTSYASLDEASMSAMLDASRAKQSNGSYFELLAVKQEDTCVGFISLYGLSETEISIGPEINPQFRNRGFAYAAEVLAMEYVRSLGFTKAVAQVREDNTASRALHEKLEFSLVRQEVNAKGRPVCWYEKNL